jgi:8-oxo-dGTP pyrophosphatase MutT (NUDIX family)
MMNISVTIPQIFYDLIARVIPGFLFLFMLNFILSGTKFEVSVSVSSDGSMAILTNAVVYVILSYLAGWMFRAATFGSVRDEVKKEHESKLTLQGNLPSMSKMYQKIRIENEAVGFRIVKLRAEARMLETSRTGMIYITLISLCLLLGQLVLSTSLKQSPVIWGTKLCIPAVLAIAFRKCERRAWNNYFGNILANYEILFKTNVRNKNDELSKLRESLKKGETASQEQLDRICKIWEKRVAPSDKDKELFVLVDSKGNFTQPKLTAPRWLCHLLALRHRCAHVLILWQSPSLGRVFVLQVRGWDKSDSPGHLDISVGGHVQEEAAPEQTAYREMREEIGIRKDNLKGGKLIPHSGYESYNERAEDNFYNAEWRDVYLGEISSLEKIRFKDKEVVGIYLCPESEAENLLEQRFIPVASALELSLPRCL